MLTACLNMTPAPKLNRYAESAVLTYIVKRDKNASFPKAFRP
jgi:hypothetical protein